MNNIERDKFLTEAMGECYHEWSRCALVSICIKCFATCEGSIYDPINNFSTWTGFGKLWEWSIKQDWWRGFAYTTQHEIYNIGPALINPDNFANAVYEYLKGRK